MQEGEAVSADTEPYLTAERVNRIFLDCLFREGEETTDPVLAEGVMLRVGFHPGRLESHRGEIMALLMDLPITFRESHGGGWTFLNACMTAAGNQWGEHANIDELLTLGIASGRVEILLPRDMWSVLPGGVPYFVVKDGPREVKS